MQTDMDHVAPLKVKLREDVSRFSKLLQALMVKYDPKNTDLYNKSTYADFQEALGHTAKDMAYAYSRLDGIYKFEPTVTEAEVIQETVRKYTFFAKDIADVGRRYGIDPREIQPLLEVVGDSIHRCEAALKVAGGPNKRRSFKFEMLDTLGSENELIGQAQKYMHPDEAIRQAQLTTFNERVLPELAKVYSLPRLVATRKLDYDDAEKTLVRIRDTLETIARGSRDDAVTVPMSPVVAPIMEKLAAAMVVCSKYAREDYQARSTGRSAS